MKAGVAARDRYLAEFRRRAGTAAMPGPDWLGRLRATAIEAFAAGGFPTTRQEGWRFTSLTPVVETPFEMNGAAARIAPAALAGLTSGAPDAPRLVFANGVFVPALSAVSGLPAGVRFEPLATAAANAADQVEPHFGRYARVADHPFAALGTAFFQDGAFLYVPAGVELKQPLEVVFLSGAHDGPSVSYPRCLAVLEPGSRAVLLESYAGLGPGTYLTTAVTELMVAEGARLDHCRVQREQAAAYHVAVSQSSQGRDSTFESCAVALGGALARHDLGAVLNGPGGFLTLNGLILAGTRQHVDHHTVIDHAQPHCESHELFNGIFDDQARGVFNGRIVVRPGAQRTDSKQTSNSLLLSDQARSDSQPQLEIYADDVKCTHGATLGPVDDASLFYLRSRGLDRDQARALLTYGFGADVVGRVRPGVLRQYLDRLLVAHLPGTRAAGV